MTMAPAARGEAKPGTVKAIQPIRALFADVRRDVQNLLVSVDRIERAMTKDAAELARVLANEALVAEREGPDFASVFAEVRALADSDADAARTLDGAVTSIKNYWERAEPIWPKLVGGKPPPAERLKQDLADIKDELRQMNYEIARINVPADLGVWIEKQKVLRPLEFDKVFEQDLPDPDDRKKILAWLVSAPEVFPDAYISPTTGKIYRVSANVSSIAWSYIVFALTLIVGGAIVTGAAYLKLLGLTPDNLSTLLYAYGGVVLGAIVHMIIDIFKTSGTEAGLFEELGLKGYVLWGHSRQGQIWKALALLFIGPFVMFIVLNDTNPLTGVFVGYSFDSILDLGLKRFDKALTAGTANITKALSAAEGAVP